MLTLEHHGGYGVMGFGKIAGERAVALHQLEACKDYLTDHICYEEKGKIQHSWLGNFNYVRDKTILVWREKDGFLQYNLSLLQEYEKELGITPTVVHTTNNEQFIVTEGDPFWQTTTIHLSMYLSLIRNCRVSYKITDLWGKHGDPYVFDVAEKLKKLPYALMELKVDRKQNAPDHGEMHSRNGHWCLLTQGHLLEELHYYPQLKDICPELLPDPNAAAPDENDFGDEDDDDEYYDEDELEEGF